MFPPPCRTAGACSDGPHRANTLRWLYLTSCALLLPTPQGLALVSQTMHTALASATRDDGSLPFSERLLVMDTATNVLEVGRGAGRPWCLALGVAR